MNRGIPFLISMLAFVVAVYSLWNVLRGAPDAVAGLVLPKNYIGALSEIISCADQQVAYVHNNDTVTCMPSEFAPEKTSGQITIDPSITSRARWRGCIGYDSAGNALPDPQPCSANAP